MKFTLLMTYLNLLLCFQTYSQSRPYTKIYIADSPSDLRTTLDPSTPLDIGSKTQAGYALLETDLDSLGLILPKNRTVFLRLGSGKVYYYAYTSGGYRDVSENAFWLTQSVYSARRFRHYRLTQQSGVVRVEDSDN